MKPTWKVRIVASIVATIVTVAGVVLLMDPAGQADRVDGPLVHPVVNLVAYVVLFLCLYDWAIRQVGHAYKTAFIIASSQFLLVNVDFVLSGKRGLLTAGASTVMLAVTWGSIAFVYSHLGTRE